MRTALTHSVNTYFAQLGESVGAETLLEYMDRFGFGSDPEVQLPDDQKAASGIFVVGGKAGFKQVDEGFDLARVAIGQGGQEGEVRASVTQMAEVAATIANGGKLMKPTLVEKVVDPDGRVDRRARPRGAERRRQRGDRRRAGRHDDQRGRRGNSSGPGR